MDAREINAQLAEHLMGWQVDRGTRPWTCHDETGIVATIGEYASYPDFAPATTGDGMLLVIEAMRKRGWAFQLHVFDDGAEAAFSQNLMSPDKVWTWGIVKGDPDAPRATSLAALAALGVQVPS